MADSAVQVKRTTNILTKEPPMFKLIYINDNETPMDFVVTSLVNIFAYHSNTAEDITMEVHENGSAVVAVLPYELAEQKGIEVTVAARKNGFPLQVKIEPDVH